MLYTFTLHESQFKKLADSFAEQKGKEWAAYIFCSISNTKNEKRFIANEIQIIPKEGIQDNSQTHVSILSASYTKALAKADREGKAIFLIHNHSNAYSHFSKQDDKEEKAFFTTAYNRNSDGIYGSLLFIGTTQPTLIGRLWLSENDFIQLDRIRIIGKRFRVFDSDNPSEYNLPSWTDRQVLAFDKKTQHLLGKLHIGVIGVGGTGSSICEQLIRLGVKQLTIIDEQTLSDTNVTRVYGSRLSDVGIPKVTLQKRHAKEIGLGTIINEIHGSVCDHDTAKELRSCDLIFCCTDDDFGRKIVNNVALWYLIPVIDMAVSIDSKDGVIHDITGRVTILLPGNACLTCRGSISHERLRSQALKRVNPEEYKRNVKEQYAQELDNPDPSIIMFTTGIASRAVSEFIHMLTGFMGDDRTATEIREQYHLTEIRKNSTKGIPGCTCVEEARWGKGDQKDFLGMKW